MLRKDMNLNEVADKHKFWLLKKKGGVFADFGRSILKGVNFSGLDFSEADFSPSDLTGSKFKQAILNKADFRHAKLIRCVFTVADLKNARFDDADLRDADLRGADARGANFTFAKLEGADLYKTKLQGADLREISLWEAKRFEYIEVNSSTRLPHVMIPFFKVSLQMRVKLLDAKIDGVSGRDLLKANQQKSHDIFLKYMQKFTK